MRWWCWVGGGGGHLNSAIHQGGSEKFYSYSRGITKNLQNLKNFQSPPPPGKKWHFPYVEKNSSFMCTLLFIIPRTVLLSLIQPEAETLDFSTHALPRNLQKIFPPREHKQRQRCLATGNDVEGCRSQKVFFQPNIRVFLQYSVNKHYWNQSNKYFSLLSSQLVYRSKVVKVINGNRFPEKRPPTSRQIFRDF